MSGWKEYRSRKGDADAPRLTLLLVDDEEKILESLTELLKGRFDVVTAKSGDRALALFAEKRPHLVLCDQRMPGRSGIEILREIKELEPGTIRMLITGYSDIDVVIEALNDEILHRYITKPWVNEELLEVVEEGAGRYRRESGMDDDDSGVLF